jgi:exosortase F-associated protein
VLLFGSFVLIRVYEENLFYDPFLELFQSDFNAAITDLRFFSFIYQLVCYGLNTVLSLGIDFTLLEMSKMVKFAAFLYASFLCGSDFFVLRHNSFLCRT